MCKSHHLHIRFCTCAEVDPTSKTYWSLSRRSKDAVNVIGQFHAPSRPEPFALYLQQFLEDDLNTVQLFDFHYEPEDGDILTIHFNDLEFSFIVDQGKFQAFLHGRNAGHEIILQGPIESSH